MIQTALEMIFGGVISLVIVIVVHFPAKHVAKAGCRSEQDVLKFPLPNPMEVDEAHKSAVLQLRRKWQVPTLIGGVSTASENGFIMALPIYSLIDDFTPTLFLGVFVFLLVFLISGLVVGMFQIVRKDAFWNAQMNPVRGIETNLSRFVQKKLKEKPKDISEHSFYPEVELSVRSNWEMAIRSALGQEIMHEIYIRELSSDDRQLLLDYLARREDIIGQIAQGVQEDIAVRESIKHQKSIMLLLKSSLLVSTCLFKLIQSLKHYIVGQSLLETMPNNSDIDLGWFTLCFDVKDMKKAVEFYQQLGFKIETGGIDKGQCQITNGNVRLSFFSDGFIQKEFGVSHLFNFRGGNVKENHRILKKLGIPFTKELEVHKDGSTDAIFEDLDGNVIYLDTHPSEVTE